MDDQPTTCPACGTVLLSAGAHICPATRQAAEDLGAAMPATLTDAANALGDPVADLEAARAMIDDARPRLPRPVFAPPVRPLPGDYSPDPPSRHDAQPAIVLPGDKLRELLGDASAAIVLAGGELTELEVRLEAATTARAWGDRLGELAAEAPDGITLAIIIRPGPTTPGEGQITEELRHAARHLDTTASQFSARRDLATGAVTLELARP